MLKTFAGDSAYTMRLIDSFNRFNVESLPLVIVAPKNDLHIFAECASPTVKLIPDEDIPVRYLTGADIPAASADPRPGRSPVGFLNQGISKLGFFKLGVFENYVCLDSDTDFIRPFGRSDFMSPSNVPLFFAQDYSDLAADPFYSHRYWQDREKCLSQVREVLEVDDAPRVTVHNSLVMSSLILENFETDFLASKSWDFADLMKICNLEFFWYGVWMQKQRVLPILQCNDRVRMINHQGEHLALFSLGIRKKDLARGYVGVIVNSNWSRQYGLVDFDTPPIDEYFSRGDWGKWVSENPEINRPWSQKF